MEFIKLDTSKCGIAISDELKAAAIEANRLLHAGKGAGNDFLGWITLPSDITADHLAEVNACAARLRKLSEVVICIGIVICRNWSISRKQGYMRSLMN